MDNMRHSLTKFYEFLKTFDYIMATTNIKSQIYEEAKKYVRSAPAQSDATGDIPICDESVAKNLSELKIEEKSLSQKVTEDIPLVQVANNKHDEPSVE